MSSNLLWCNTMADLLASLEQHWKGLADSLVGLCLLLGTYAAYRTKRWLLELADRERERGERLLEQQQAREVQRANATLKRFTEALTLAEQPSLDDWLKNAERDWSLQASEQSPPTDQLHGTRTRSESGLQRIDWSDDDDKTRPETPESRAARKPPSDWPSAD